MKKFLTLLVVVGFFYCYKSILDVESDLPICMEDVTVVADIVDNISKIIQYDYNGEKVYLLHYFALVVDYGPLLYNDTCRYVYYFSCFSGWQAADKNNIDYCINYDSLKVNEIVICEKP